MAIAKEPTRTGTGPIHKHDVPESASADINWLDDEPRWTDWGVTLNENDAPLSHVFPAVRCNRAYLDYMSFGEPGNRLEVPPHDQCGFYLMGKYLVPLAFLERVHNALVGQMIQCASVQSLKSLFANEFLNSLTADEENVLGQCVLALLERGMAAMEFTDYSRDEMEAA